MFQKRQTLHWHPQPKAPGNAQRMAGQSVAAMALRAVLSTILFVALCIAGFGLTSLATGRDVIADVDVGPLRGPIMLVCAALLVCGAVWWGLARWYDRSAGYRLGASALVALAAAAVYLASGALLAYVASGVGLDAALFVAWMAQSAYPLIVGLAALIVVLVALSLGSAKAATWPWEHDET